MNRLMILITFFGTIGTMFEVIMLFTMNTGLSILIGGLAILLFFVETIAFPSYLTYSACLFIIFLILTLFPNFNSYDIYSYLLLGGLIISNAVGIGIRIRQYIIDVKNGLYRDDYENDDDFYY